MFFVTKGGVSRGLLAYSAGNVAYSMQTQTYCRDKGNETEAQKYEAEGAEATKDLVFGED